MTDHPDAMSPRIASAVAALETGDLARAELELARASATHPWDAAVQGARIRFMRGDLEGASAAFEHALQERPGSPDVLAWLAGVRHEQGRFDDALSGCEDALGLEEGHGVAHYNACRALRALGRPEEALQQAQGALVAHPDLAAAHLELAELLHELGRSEEAQHAVAELLERAPGQEPAYFLAAQIFVDLRQPDRAVEMIEGAVSADPTRPALQLLLAELLLRSGRVDELEPRLPVLDVVCAGDVEALGELAALYTELDLHKEAARVLGELLQIDARNADALRRLGTLRVLAGDHDGGVSTLQEAVAAEPTRHEARSDLALVLLSTGEPDAIRRARALLLEAIELVPDEGAVVMNLGMAAAMAGDREEAIAHLEKASALLPPGHPDQEQAASLLARTRGEG